MVPFAPLKHNTYLILGPKVSQKCILGFFWTLNEWLAQNRPEVELFVVKFSVVFSQISYFILGPKVSQKYILSLFRDLNEGFTLLLVTIHLGQPKHRKD